MLHKIKGHLKQVLSIKNKKRLDKPKKKKVQAFMLFILIKDVHLFTNAQKEKRNTFILPFKIHP